MAFDGALLGQTVQYASSEGSSEITDHKFNSRHAVGASIGFKAQPVF